MAPERGTPDGRGETHALCVLTYNVLAQCYVRSAFFPYCDPKVLKWKVRSRMLKEQIEAIQPRPDVLCLQECDQYDDFWRPTMLEMGYDSLYLKKTGAKKDGVGIFWLQNKFTVLGGENISLNDALETATDEDLRGRLIRDNVGIICHFQRNDDPSVQFVVASTHLFWDPAQADVKLAQVNVMLQRLEAFRSQPSMGQLPVFFAGDFNSLPQSEVYNAVLSTGLSSAYATYRDGDSEPAFTNINGVVTTEQGKTAPAFAGTLDYIFYDSRLVKVATLLPLMEYDKATNDGGALPNRTTPSDHLPLMATFLWR